MMRRLQVLGAVIAVLAAVCALSPSAGAVVVHIRHQRPIGVIPVRGVRPASIPGSITQSQSASASDPGTVQYHGGPVLHGSTPYLIFWDPNRVLTSTDKSLFTR